MSTKKLRDKVAHALEIEFGSFLAHDPHNPTTFYGQAADSLMRTIAVGQTKMTADALSATTYWKRAADQYMSAPECARLAGIKPNTFTAYVNRGYAPEPVATIAGRRVYGRAQIEEWVNERKPKDD